MTIKTIRASYGMAIKNALSQDKELSQIFEKDVIDNHRIMSKYITKILSQEYNIPNFNIEAFYSGIKELAARECKSVTQVIHDGLIAFYNKKEVKNEMI